MSRHVFFALAIAFACGASARAQVLLSENFDVVDDNLGIPTTTPGWVNINRSNPPPVPASTYFQGIPTSVEPTLFDAQAGAPNSYIAVNYQCVGSGVADISNWLITPALTISNGTTMNFFTRTVTVSASAAVSDAALSRGAS